MITLPLKLRKNGFDYIQVLRGLRSCLYAQIIPESMTYYEVFLIKIKPEKEIYGKIIPEREIFPHNEAFGTWAWSYQDYEKAVRKINELEQIGKNKNCPHSKRL